MFATAELYILKQSVGSPKTYECIVVQKITFIFTHFMTKCTI